MRGFISGLLFLLISLSTQGAAQSKDSTLFYAENLASFQAPIPRAALKALMKRREVREALQYSGSAKPSDLFHAASVHLHLAEQSDLMVVGQYPVSGADNAWFWLITSANTHPKVVLWSGCNTIEILRSSTVGYRNIVTHAATAAITIREVFHFDGSTYRSVKRTESDIK
jgi:hypothetical protein